ncbi:non-ribosomal peptide synthetase [Streptomyces sp. NPDC001680]
MFSPSVRQQGLWFLDRQEGPSSTYNVPSAVWLEGELDREALQLALGDVVVRHDTLRTVFEVRGDRLYQRVLEVGAAGVELPVIAVADDEVPATLARLAATPFDLAADPPFRAQLLRVSEDRHVLSVVMHHIATDGASDGPLFRDLALAYRARCAGEEPRWEPLPVRYADYAAWQREFLGDPADPGSEAARQLAYWKQALRGLPEEAVLRADHARPAVASHRGLTHSVCCPPELHSRLVEIARDTGTTLFMVLQAATAALLAASGAGDDIPIGVPVDGRSDEALEDLVGFFVNTVVLRTRTDGDPSFRQLLERVRETDIAAWANQDVPFDWVVEELNPERSTARNPLFQVLMTLQDAHTHALELPGLVTRFATVDTAVAKFDLSFGFTRHHTAEGAPGELSVSVEGSTDLYEPETVRAVAERLVKLLEAVAADPDALLSRIDLLDGRERERVLSEWAGRVGPWPTATLVERFEEQAARRPHAVAVVCGDEQVTYAELNARANRLARLLVARGARPESLVAVLLGRSAELAVALLAVLKSGAAYVPVDPEYPSERIATLFAEADPALVVTATAHTRSLPLGLDAARTVVLDAPGTPAELEVQETADLNLELSSGYPAYVIYTSGSTGRPKGVTIAHGSVIAILDATRDQFSFGPDDVWSWFHSYAFDVSVWEMWGSLTHGGSLVVVPFEVSRSPKEFLGLIERERVTVLCQTPSAFYPLIREDARQTPELSLCTVIFAGEALDFGQLEGWFARHADDVVRLVNMYGITETTIHATYAALDREMAAGAAGRSLVGLPLPGLRMFVLDDALRPVPVGVVGELYVAGPQLARGYLNRPDLTAQRFVACPFEPGRRMYRSGDLARWTREGQLEYLGRVDDQVQLRGFRVELGEVQAVFTRHPKVAQGAVLVREDTPGDQRLVAYGVPADEEVTTEELHAYLRDWLPGYMVPGVVLVDELPLTPNGKLDRRALPAWTVVGQTVSRSAATSMERELCALIAEILDVPEVGVDDNFFGLGGHSLLAVMFLERTKEITGAGDATLTIRDLYRCPTVAQLAEHLTTHVRGNPLEPVLTMQEGVGEPLFCMPMSSGLCWSFSGILPHIDDRLPVVGLQSEQLLAPGAKPRDFAELVEAHVARMREARPHGPYHVMGWSFGGVLAHAVAVRLESLGERVATLALLDARPLPEDRPVSASRRWVMEVLLGHRAGDLAEPETDEELVELLRAQDPVLGMLEPKQVAAVVATTAGNGDAFLGYDVQGHFSGDMLFFNAVRTSDGTGRDAWAPYIGGKILEYDMDCGHMEMAQHEQLGAIGKVLDGHLKTAGEAV